MDSYLKCEYAPGLFSHEHLITFNSSRQYEGWMFVNKNDVTPITEKEGLVKLLGVIEIDLEHSRVFINDVGDHRISNRVVPREEVVFK